MNNEIAGFALRYVPAETGTSLQGDVTHPQ
jgi:hypothetical protein